MSGFPKQSRLLYADDYSLVFQNPDFKLAGPFLLILARNSGPAVSSRLGIVVARKNIAAATQRNRIKRIIREAFRVRKAEFDTIDIVVLAKRGLDALENREIKRQLNTLFNDLNKKIKQQGSDVS